VVATRQWWQRQDFKLRHRLLSVLLRLDAGRGLVFPFVVTFVATCLPDENHPEVLTALIKSWPSGVACPEAICRQWEEKVSLPVDGSHDWWMIQVLRELGWQALLWLPSPGMEGVSPRPWLSLLRRSLAVENSWHVLNSIWKTLNGLKEWEGSSGEKAAWLVELEQYSRFGSEEKKASDQFVTRHSLLREAIIWRVLFGMRCPPAESPAPVSLGERMAHCLPGAKRLLLLEVFSCLPAMESERPAWLRTWRQYGLRPELQSWQRRFFWKAMVEAAQAGWYLPEEVMEEAIRMLAVETDWKVLETAAGWRPVGERMELLWHDLWRPHLTNRQDNWQKWAWRAWCPASAGGGGKCFSVRW